MELQIERVKERLDVGPATTKERINAGLAAIVDVQYSPKDAEELLARAKALLEYIESLPNYLVSWPKAYVQTAAVIIRTLSGIYRHVDAVLFADVAIEKFKIIHSTENQQPETLALICRAVSRAAYSYSRVGNKKQAFR